MRDKFPMPPRAAEFSEFIKLLLKESAEQGGTRETVTVERNGKPLHVEVVEVSLDKLYFNPATHRIRAQRSHDPDRDQILETHPYSDEAQDYLFFLLQAEPSEPRRRDPEFDKLKNSLNEFGQTDPGLVTHSGVLVNGNTRAAALRELEAKTMRVGVLPESFTWTDIFSVELSLQMRRDHRRDYSFINRLMAMEEFALMGWSDDGIAREFRIQTRTVERERWIYALITELIERSAGPVGSKLRMVDFEDQQEKLRELHRAYSKAYASDPEQADILKELRISAILLGFAKTDIRVIENSNFQDSYLRPHLPPDTFDAEPTAGEEVPGLDLTLPDESGAVVAARELTDQVLREKADSLPDSPTSEARRAEASKAFTQLYTSFDEAIVSARRQVEIKKRKQLAPARLKAAKAEIEQCVADVVQARASRTFDQDAFDQAVVELRASLNKLAQQASRGVPEPGDGVAWLIAAASVKADT